MGVLTPVDDGLVRCVILPYLATRGFIEGRNLVVDLRVGTSEQFAGVGASTGWRQARCHHRYIRLGRSSCPRSDEHYPDCCRTITVWTQSAPASPRVGRIRAATSPAFA